MDQMMNNPQMMASMQQLMSDPEIVALLSKPEVMAKMQQLMANPAGAMQMMNDPDIRLIVSKLQGMGRGGAGMGSAAGAGAAGHSNNVVHIRDAAQFENLVKQTKNKLIVVDFTASWCGPCKMIAPVFTELADANAGKAIFLKVDGDENKQLVASKGIKGYPTFHFYLNGNLVDQFSGAQADLLRNKVSQYVLGSLKRNAPSPYKHFPLRENELVSYKDIKFDLVLDHLRKLNEELTAKPEADRKGASPLTADELKHLDSLATLLNDVNTYHLSTIAPAQYAAVEKMLKWPVEFVGAALHFVRIIVRHPHGASTYARAAEEKDKGFDVITTVAKFVSVAQKAATIDTGLRTLSNMFGRRVMSKAIVAKREAVLDAVAAVCSNNDAKLRLSYLNLLINFAILFADDAEAYQDGKVQVLSNLIELFGVETEAPSVYRALVVLGTLVFRDTNAKQMAKDLEVPALVQRKGAQFSADANAKDCADELARCFESADD